MAIYAIGDVQGCYDSLKKLLDKINFDPQSDTLWFVGDIVNRGPKSLKTLRFIKKLGSNAITVLGNHDLNLLAVAYGFRPAKPRDTLDNILAAPDRDELLHWLRHKPLLHHDETLGFAMVHAGLPPQWDIDTAKQLAHEVESVLQSDHFKSLLKNMYGDEPHTWSEELSGMERYRFITNCFTRLRFCTNDGRLNLQEKGPPGTQANTYIPWFNTENRLSKDTRIVFGHWSTLSMAKINTPNIYPLDTGCVWGNQLTAMRLDDESLPIVSVNSQEL